MTLKNAWQKWKKLINHNKNLFYEKIISNSQLERLWQRRAQRDHDVAEQDGRVHVVPAQRLQGDFRDQVGAGTRIEHRDALAHPAVLGQRPARLPHEPDGRIGNWLSPAGLHEGGLRPGHGHVRDRLTSPPHGSRRETRRPRSHESARERATIGINSFNPRKPRDASHRGGRQDDAAEQRPID